MSSPDETVRVAVIGCGTIAQLMHLPHLRDLDGFDLTTVCDVDPDLAAEMAARYGARPADDYRTVLDDPAVDAVVIAASSSLHAEIGLAALQAGKHVFVEKPLCTTPAEGEALVAAASQAGRLLMVGYHKRYDPGYELGSEALRAVTDLRFIRVHDFGHPNQLVIDDVATIRRGRLAPEQTAALNRPLAAAAAHLTTMLGRVPDQRAVRAYLLLLGLASHDISALRGIFGDPCRLCWAEVYADASSPYVLAVFDYGDEVRCTFEIGNSRRKWFDESITAYGLTSTAAIVWPSPYLRAAPTEVVVQAMEDGGIQERRIIAGYREAFQCELEHFHAAITRGEPLRTPGEEGLADVRWLSEIIVQAAQNTDQSLRKGP